MAIRVENNILKSYDRKEKKISKRLEKRLLKLSKEEIIELLNLTMNKYWYDSIDFLPTGLTHFLDLKDLEELEKKQKKELEDFEKASKEYQDFMNEMFDKYGSPLNLLKLTCKELAKYTTLYNNWRKECLRGIDNVKN